MKLIYIFAIILTLMSSLSAVWEKTNGPTGGYVNRIYEWNGDLYVATGGSLGENGSVYKSSDNGDTWNLCSSNFNLNFGVFDLAGNSTYLFAGTKGLGLYRTDNPDNGWTNIDSIDGLGQINITSLFAEDNILVIGTLSDGVFVSYDDGENWQSLNYNLSGNSQRINDIIRVNDYLVIGTPSGAYKLDDENWSLLDNQLQNYVYEMDYDGEYVFVSGVNASYRFNPDTLELVALPFTNSKWFKHYDSTVYTSENQTIYTSQDSGVNWNSIELVDFNTNLRINDFVISDDAWLIANEVFSVFKSNDQGQTWSRSSKGISNITVNDMTEYQDNLYATSEFADFGLVYSTDNQGDDWDIVEGGLDIFGYDFIFSNNQIMLVSSFGFGLYRSEDGVNWQHLNQNDYPPSYSGQIIEHEGSIYTGAKGFLIDVYKSTDSGNSFQALSVPGEGDIIALLSMGDMIVYGRTDNVYYSNDEGENWNVLGNGFQSLPFITQLVDYLGTVFTIANRQIYYLDNNNDWIHFEMPDNAQVASLKTIDNTLLIGTYNNGLYTYNQQDSFSLMNEGLPVGDNGLSPKIMCIKTYDDNVYLSVEMYGIYKEQLSVVSSIDKTIPLTSNKLSVYPNPITGTTEKVNLRIEDESLTKSINKTDVSVYNLKGQRIRVLHKGFSNVSDKDIQWDGKDDNSMSVSSGVYFFKVESGNETNTAKVVIIR